MVIPNERQQPDIAVARPAGPGLNYDYEDVNVAS